MKITINVELDRKKYPDTYGLIMGDVLSQVARKIEDIGNCSNWIMEFNPVRFNDINVKADCKD